MTKLTGSEKQVKWAEGLVEQFEKNANERIERLDGRPSSPGAMNSPQKVVAELREGLKFLETAPIAKEAKFWINNKNSVEKPEYIIRLAREGKINGVV